MTTFCDRTVLAGGPSIFVFASGFKLDTLLKLADVKGTDRKTSLLHFVLEQLLKEDARLRKLPQELGTVKPASNIQVSTRSGCVADWVV